MARKTVFDKEYILKRTSEFIKDYGVEAMNARDLCKYALDNPNYCKDIIEASNEYIEKYGRWSDNFEKIGELVKVSVTNSEIKITRPINFAENITVKKQKPPKKRIKQIINGGLLMLSNIPVLELIFSEKMQKKLYSSINKHNNF